MLTVKDHSVHFEVFTPALMRIINVVYQLSQQHEAWFNGPVVITSANDGQHMTGSRHYRNEALDIRSHNWSGQHRDDILEWLRTQLGPSFTVLFESEGLANEHCHIQVKKGMTYDDDGSGRP